MAKFLFTVWPFAGHVHPGIAVAHALQARGHEVAFYTGSSVRRLVEGEGFRCFPFDKVNEERINTLVTSEIPGCMSFWERLRHARLLQTKFREWLLDTVPQQADDIDAVMAAWKPDVLVCDLAFWSPILVLRETRQIPVAVLSILAACLLPGPDAPAWGRGKPRPRNWRMRLSSKLERTSITWLSAGFRARVNVLRRRYGLEPLCCSVTEYTGQMPLYLVPSTPEYDYQRGDLPRSVEYVGPCLWDKPSRMPAPEWLARLPSDRPLVYITEATIGTQEPFLLKAALQAFRGQLVEVIMTTGKQRKPAELDLGPPAPNVRIEAYVPQSDLLPKMSVMVTLGGSGGVLAALKAGVPLVIVPTEWDRPENAQRVVEAGAGLRIAANRCTPVRLRTAVGRVLSEASFRESAQRLSRAFAQYEGPISAAKALEHLYNTSAGRSARAERANSDEQNDLSATLAERNDCMTLEAIGSKPTVSNATLRQAGRRRD